jgi:hypothetical protein
MKERQLTRCQAEIIFAMLVNAYKCLQMLTYAYKCVDDWIILSMITEIVYVLIIIRNSMAWQGNMG